MLITNLANYSKEYNKVLADIKKYNIILIVIMVIVEICMSLFFMVASYSPLKSSLIVLFTLICIAFLSCFFNKHKKISEFNNTYNKFGDMLCIDELRDILNGYNWHDKVQTVYVNKDNSYNIKLPYHLIKPTGHDYQFTVNTDNYDKLILNKYDSQSKLQNLYDDEVYPYHIVEISKQTRLDIEQAEIFIEHLLDLDERYRLTLNNFYKTTDKFTNKKEDDSELVNKLNDLSNMMGDDKQ